MRVPTFDIFSGRVGKEAVWIDCGEGLIAAAERMHTFAASTPGPYYVFCARTHTVLTSIDTSNSGEGDQNVTA